MYNMIHANQQVDEHEKFKSLSLCGCAFHFQFGINLLI